MSFSASPPTDLEFTPQEFDVSGSGVASNNGASPRRKSSSSPRTARGSFSPIPNKDAKPVGAPAQRVQVLCRVRPFNPRELELQEKANAEALLATDTSTSGVMGMSSLATASAFGTSTFQPLRSVLRVEKKATIFLDHTKGFAEKQRFPFDKNLWSIPDTQQEPMKGVPIASQGTVMDEVGAPVLEHVWAGYNACIFAYGQTGAGKTHTMMGSGEDPGLIPHMCQRLFDELDQRNKAIAEECSMFVGKQSDKEGDTDGVTSDDATSMNGSMPTKKNSPKPELTQHFSLEARFFEIYNERVKDLLWSLRPFESTSATSGEKVDNAGVSGEIGHGKEFDKDNLKVRLKKEGPEVVGLTCVPVRSAAECQDVIDEGTRKRSVAATKMNEASSRSHSIFQLTLVQTTIIPAANQFERPKQLFRRSIVSLVDLAGSERNKKSGAEGQRLKEAVAINQSLTTLKNVIDALVEKRPVVPYRDSTLTYLLSENLGGNSCTYMIACVSPHLDNAEETLNTLRYALRSQAVSLNAKANESDELKRVGKAKAEIAKLKQALASNTSEAWEERLQEVQERVEELEEIYRIKREAVDRALASAAILGPEARKKNSLLVASFRRAFALKAMEMYDAKALEATETLPEVTLAADRLEVIARRETINAKMAKMEEVCAAVRAESLTAQVEKYRATKLGREDRISQMLLEGQEVAAKVAEKKRCLTAGSVFLTTTVVRERQEAGRKRTSQSAALVAAVDQFDEDTQKMLAAVEEDARCAVRDAEKERDAAAKHLTELEENRKKTAAELEAKAGRLHAKTITLMRERDRLQTEGASKIRDVQAHGLDKFSETQNETRAQVAAEERVQEEKMLEKVTVARTRRLVAGGEAAAAIARTEDAAQRSVEAARRKMAENITAAEAQTAARRKAITTFLGEASKHINNTSKSVAEYQALYHKTAAAIRRKHLDHEAALLCRLLDYTTDPSAVGSASADDFTGAPSVASVALSPSASRARSLSPGPLLDAMMVDRSDRGGDQSGVALGSLSPGSRDINNTSIASAGSGGGLTTPAATNISFVGAGNQSPVIPALPIASSPVGNTAFRSIQPKLFAAPTMSVPTTGIRKIGAASGSNGTASPQRTPRGQHRDPLAATMRELGATHRDLGATVRGGSDPLAATARGGGDALGMTHRSTRAASPVPGVPPALQDGAMSPVSSNGPQRNQPGYMTPKGTKVRTATPARSTHEPPKLVAKMTKTAEARAATSQTYVAAKRVEDEAEAVAQRTRTGIKSPARTGAAKTPTRSGASNTRGGAGGNSDELTTVVSRFRDALQKRTGTPTLRLRAPTTTNTSATSAGGGAPTTPVRGTTTPTRASVAALTPISVSGSAGAHSRSPAAASPASPPPLVSSQWPASTRQSQSPVTPTFAHVTPHRPASPTVGAGRYGARHASSDDDDSLSPKALAKRSSVGTSQALLIGATSPTVNPAPVINSMSDSLRP